jgi:nucleoside-diphosphate-sugar epimerase
MKKILVVGSTGLLGKPVTKALKIKRIANLYSLVHFFQGINNFDWWVFRIK